MQVLESEDNRLGPRPGQNPGGHRRQLPSPQLFGREIRGAARRQRDVHERREQGRVFGWVEADQTQRAFEVGEALLGRRIRTKSLPAPFGDWMQRRVLQELRGAPFDPGVRRFCEPRVELLDRAATCRGPVRRRSARAGLRPRERAPSGARAAPNSSSRPTNGVSVRAPPLRPPPLARTMRKSWTGAGDALEFARALAPRRRRARRPGAGRSW